MILSIDQGTTGTTAYLIDKQGNIVSKAYNEFTQIYPNPSWVEHDPLEIWDTTLKTIKEVIQNTDINSVGCIGITNQRETTVMWDKRTGKPIYNAIVWQCRRSSEICEEIKKENKSEWIHKKTGLVIDAYFSATKIKWILENVKDAKSLADQGFLAFGTIDTWLIWKLTNGSSHLTDHTNASRTMLYNIQRKEWDNELLEYFDIPKSVLPKIQNSISTFGKTHLFGTTIQITGVAGDQQAALFGQRCILPGRAKNTYGTGCFMLMYLGEKLSYSNNGLLTTIACDIQGKPTYAIEGSVFIAGAAVQWLRDELSIITNASDTEDIAYSINDTKGVYIVPAFTGLGAPYWDMDARGTILGLTRGSGKKEIVRATLESIAYQTKDVLDLMEKETGITLDALYVDGGACKNNFLMEFQSDLLNIEINRPKYIESTAIGAALLAGIGASIWSYDKLPENLNKTETIFSPQKNISNLYLEWKKAVSKARSSS